MASKLRKNLFKLFGSNALIKPIWFLYMYAVIRVLGKEDFGTFTLMLATITIVTQLLDAGLVNKSYVLLNDKQFKKLFSEQHIEQLLIYFKICVGSLIGLIAISSAFFFDEFWQNTLIYGSLIFLGIFLTQQYRVIFRAFELFTLEAWSVFLERLFVILFTIDLFNSPYNFIKYATRYAFGYVGFLLITMLFFERFIGHKRIVFHLKDFVTLVKQAGSLYVNNIILSIRQRLPFYILENIGSRAIVGIYSSAYRFVESYMFLPNSIVQVTYAEFSQKAAEAKDFAQDIWRSHQLIFLPTLLIVSLAIILMPFVIDLLLGEEFLSYIDEYRLAMLIFLPNGSYYLLTSLSNIFHIQHKVNYLYVFNFSTLVITQFLFYSFLGIKGSILSMLLSEYIMVFEYHYALSKYTELKRSKVLDITSFILSGIISSFILLF